MSDNPGAPADPVIAEDALYVAIVNEFRGLRRAGAGWIEAALLVGAHLTIVNAVNEG